MIYDDNVNIVMIVRLVRKIFRQALFLKDWEKMNITSCFCRYVKIVKEEGLEISQPALDPNSTEIHHRITIRARNKKFHR